MHPPQAHPLYPPAPCAMRRVAILAATSMAMASAAVIPPATDLPPLTTNHPQLLLQDAAWEQLQQELQGPRRDEATAFLSQADAVTRITIPQGSANVDLRQAGNHLATLAFAWRLTQNERYLTAASEWAALVCRLPTWATDPHTGKPADKGLPYGHLLLGLAMLHDYAGEQLSADMESLIVSTLRTRGGSAAHALARGTWNEGHALLSNHTWVYATGVMAAGLALLGEEPEAPAWIAQAVAILRASDELLPPDGSIQEGPGYWQYGVEYLIKLTELAKGAGIAVPHGPWWSHAADYPLYLSLPHQAWTVKNFQVDLADAARSPWYGPDYLVRWCARREQDADAQGFAAAISRAQVGAATSPWLDLIGHDPALLPKPLGSKPTLHHFTDLDLVSARSDWSGNEALVVAKSGQSIGDHALKTHAEWVDHGEMFHVHRDANDLCLFGAGDWLLRNPGYGMRDARLHNTLTIDGQGQLGDPGQPPAWPLSLDHPRLGVVSATSETAVDRIVLQAAGAYAPALGLRCFRRELVFFKPGALVVIDDLATEQPRTLELWFHPEHPLEGVAPHHYESHGPVATLHLEIIDPAADVTCVEQPLKDRHFASQAQAIPAVKIARRTTRWRNISVFSWAPHGTAPIPVTVRTTAGTTHLTWGTATVDVPPVTTP